MLAPVATDVRREITLGGLIMALSALGSVRVMGVRSEARVRMNGHGMEDTVAELGEEGGGVPVVRGYPKSIISSNN